MLQSDINIENEAFMELIYCVISSLERYSQSLKFYHCVKDGRIRVFSDLYYPVSGQNQRSHPYTGKYESEKTTRLRSKTQTFSR